MSREYRYAFIALSAATLSIVIGIACSVWDARKREWVTDQTDTRIAELPPSGTWEWWCGYQDEQCVCEKVLVP